MYIVYITAASAKCDRSLSVYVLQLIDNSSNTENKHNQVLGL